MTWWQVVLTILMWLLVAYALGMLVFYFVLAYLDRKLADAWNDVEEDAVDPQTVWEQQIIAMGTGIAAQRTLASDFRNELYRRIKDIDVKVDCPHANCVYGPHNPRPDWVHPDRTSIHYGPVHEVVIHLNDAHHVSREDIANWLDSLDLDLEVHQDPVRKSLAEEEEEQLAKYIQPVGGAYHPLYLTDQEKTDLKAAISKSQKALYSEQLNQLFYDPLTTKEEKES